MALLTFKRIGSTFRRFTDVASRRLSYAGSPGANPTSLFPKRDEQLWLTNLRLRLVARNVQVMQSLKR